jgi:PhoH-like ATPase
MIKNYIIDTNILLLDPEALFKFEDNNIIIPIGVIEELDKFKKDQSELGKNARHVSRTLDVLRQQGDLREGVKVGKGKLMVRYNGNLHSFYKESNVDLHVIHIAQKIVEEDKDIPCIIVSRDINVRIRANALGLKAENYESDQVPHTEIDKGYSETTISEKAFEELAQSREISVDDLVSDIKLFPNHYLVVHKDSITKSSLLARVDQDGRNIKRLLSCPAGIGLTPKNKEQGFVVDALLDNNIKLVSIAGKAGSGKTLLACAVGYYLTVRKKDYKRLLVSRPVFPMGKDIGYLPGDIGEKLDPWMTPIYDAFDVIKHEKQGSGKYLIDGCDVMVEPLTYIRGRSIRDQFLIIDESQNLNSHEIKTIITRAGENTKVVLTGDIYQIDNPYIDSLSNGLSVVTQNMRDSKLSANIVLEKGVRSELAEEAANKL